MGAEIDKTSPPEQTKHFGEILSTKSEVRIPQKNYSYLLWYCWLSFPASRWSLVSILEFQDLKLVHKKPLLNKKIESSLSNSNFCGSNKINFLPVFFYFFIFITKEVIFLHQIFILVLALTDSTFGIKIHSIIYIVFSLIALWKYFLEWLMDGQQGTMLRMNQQSRVLKRLIWTC